MSRVVCETWDPPSLTAGPRFWVAQRFQRCDNAKRPNKNLVIPNRAESPERNLL
jgi:hypothetical protein